MVHASPPQDYRWRRLPWNNALPQTLIVGYSRYWNESLIFNNNNWWIITISIIIHQGGGEVVDICWAMKPLGKYPPLSLTLRWIIYNYPLKGRWIVVDIIIPRREASRYISTALHRPWGDSCFSIYQIRWTKRRFFNFNFNFNWISKDIPSYGSQSKRAKIAIHWFGKY